MIRLLQLPFTPEECAIGFPLLEFTDRVTGCWAETAALMECMDLLVTADAVVANVATGKIGATRTHVAHDITCTINAGRPEWLIP